MTNMKDFSIKDAVLAHAVVPDDYEIGAALNNQKQHDRVPFSIAVHAINTEKNIMIFAISEQKYSSYKNQMLLNLLRNVPTTNWEVIRDFIEPEEYLKQVAESVSQMKLTATATADLPSVFAANLKQKHEELLQEYQMYFDFDTQSGVPTYGNNSICKPYLIRYEANKNGNDFVVLGGMDYKGIEYYSDKTGFQMFGSIIGMNFGNNQSNETSSKQFGHGNPCDVIEWGAENHFIMVCPKDEEKEATKDFLQFVGTYHMDNALLNRYYELKVEAFQMQMNQSMQYQSMAQQSQANLRYQQQKLTNMLASNSASISAGIMDSWNKKMDSQARTSQAFSEAIRGIDTYQTSSGKNVEVGLSADHVYENKYGDVYGVSGKELDNELLNKLDWKEIHKK